MAEDDIGLDIGINFDEDQFRTSFNRFLSNLNQDTKNFLRTTLDEMKGAASKDWASLPYFGMHQNSTGSARAAEAFIPSYAADLQKLGIAPGSDLYNSALMSASYRSTIPSALERRGLLLAQGRNALGVNSLAERVMSADYALMQQPWSREYAAAAVGGGYSAEELEKLNKKELYGKIKELGLKGYSKANKSQLIEALVSETGAASLQFDFDKMRERAVEEGLGKWTDPKKEHTAENFELIDRELDKINDKSEKAGKTFDGWHDTLKGVLGTLAAMGHVAVRLGGAGLIAEKLAERTVEGAAKTTDARRGFLGMTVSEVLEAQTAGKRVGLSGDTVFNEIEKLSSQREEFLTLGKGLDPLYSSLQGTFGIIATEEDPYERYKKMASRLYTDLKDADPATLQKNLMYLDKQGLGSLAHIVGSFISNPDLAKQFDNDPAKLFSLLSNPYREGAYGRAEQINAEMQPLKESIKASYVELADLWMESFGTPFLGWWDKFLQNKIVPWFDKFSTPPTTEEDASLATLIWFQTNQKTVSALVDARNKAIEGNVSAQNNFRHTMLQEPADNPLMSRLGAKDSGWNMAQRFALLPAYNSATMLPESGYEIHKAWTLYKEFAELSDDKLKKLYPGAALYSSAKDKQQRVRDIIKLYQDYGLDRFLENKQAEHTDIPLINTLRLGTFGDYDVADAQAIVDKLVNAGTSLGSNNTNKLLEQLVTILSTIAGDTGSIDAVVKSPEFRLMSDTLGGRGTAESVANMYNERQMRGIGRQ